MSPSSTRVKRQVSKLRVHPSNPRYFIDDGQPVVLVGRYCPEVVCWTDRELGLEMEAFLDWLAELGVNFTQFWAIHFSARKGMPEPPECNWQSLAPPHMPFLRTGPGQDFYGLLRYNLARYDPAFFERAHQFVRGARERGIYVEITLFDRCGLEPTWPARWWCPCGDVRWAANPWNPRNSVNRTGLPTEATEKGGIPAFYDLKNERLLHLQQAYVDKMLREFGDYGHVLFNVCNEYRGGHSDWPEHWVNYLSDRTDQPVAVNYLGTPPRGAEHARVEAINYHNSASVELVDGGRKAFPLPQIDRAIVQDDDGYHPYEGGLDGNAEIRKYAWSCFTAGMHFATMNHGGAMPALEEEWTSKYLLGQLYHQLDLHDMAHMLPFMAKVDFVHMAPHDELLSESHHGQCLANPGQEYVIYLRYGGAVAVDLSTAKGDLWAEWYNPRSGEYGEQQKAKGGGLCQFSAPDSEDWVLYLHL